jgi:hypothetical protein
MLICQSSMHERVNLALMCNDVQRTVGSKSGRYLVRETHPTV